MNDNSEQNPQSEGITPYQPQSGGEITPSNPANSDLSDISQSLVQRVENSEDIAEIAQIISVLSSVEDLKERRIKQDEIKFRRKIEIGEVITRKIFSIAVSGIGVALIPNTPLFAPLLIIIGLSGVLDFQLKDVSELLSSMNNNPLDFSDDEDDQD